MREKSLIIGSSDGIGLALTRSLLEQNWTVAGVSRSESSVSNPLYTHSIADVRDPDYPALLNNVCKTNDHFDLCLYSAGVGELLDITDMSAEIRTMDVNLMGMIRTVSVILPRMIERGSGHFMGISSVADILISPEAPAYHASKAGFSAYLESLALALKNSGVAVTNLRFGFVDTKMAKGDVKPFMMPVERAVKHILTCIQRKPIRYTAPKIVIPLVKFRDFMLRLKL